MTEQETMNAEELETAAETEEAAAEEAVPKEAAPETAAEETPEQKLQEALEQVQAELTAEKDSHLRLMAEYQNYRNRTTEEKKKIYGDAKSDCIKQLLTVVDTFEMALKAECADENYKKGVEMTFAQMQKVLEQLGVTAFGEVGEDFDPNLHMSVSQMDNSDMEADKLCAVYQKGYQLGDRLIRPAMVAVSV